VLGRNVYIYPFTTLKALAYYTEINHTYNIWTLFETSVESCYDN